MFVRRGRRVVRLCVWSDYRRAVSLDPGGDWSLPHQEGSTGVNGSLAYRRKKVSGELTADRNTNASHLRGNRALLVTSSLTLYRSVIGRIRHLEAMLIIASTNNRAYERAGSAEYPDYDDFVPGYEASPWYGVGTPKNTLATRV